MKKYRYDERPAEAKTIWSRFCAILDATERQYVSYVMPVLVDLYRRHEKVCGNETDRRKSRKNVELLYEIHHIDELGPEIATKVRKIMREFEIKYQAQEMLKKIRLINGGRKDPKPRPKTLRGDLKPLDGQNNDTRKTRDDLEKLMDELAREFAETHDSETPERLQFGQGGFESGD